MDSVLHAVRLGGYVDTAAVADRAGLATDDVSETLEDFRAYGWVTWSEFFDLGGWSLTDAGKAENERQLAEDRAVADPGGVIARLHEDFLPLNARLLRACTNWQTRPTGSDPVAQNDHTDAAWDEAVFRELRDLHAELVPLNRQLVVVMERFDGYARRFGEAVSRSDVDTCHRVWFELHEDLIATLGLTR